MADAHVHFFSRPFFSALAATRGLSAEAACQTLGWSVPPADPVELGRLWVEELDRHGVARACLIASVPGDEDSVAAAVASAPTRFFGYFMVNPLAEGAAARVERALTQQRLQGICLFPAMHRFSIQDDRLRAILDVATAHPHTVVFVHCGVLTVGVRKKLGLPSPFDMRYSNPMDLHAVALAFPGLRFVIPHFGAGYFREALMLCDLCPNVLLDTSSTNSWMRYEDLDLATVFRRALGIAGAERLLFGSDSSFFPRGWHAEIFDRQLRTLQELGRPESEIAAIFGGNLERLLLE